MLPSINITFTPRGEKGIPRKLDVVERISGLTGHAAVPMFREPIFIATVRAQAYGDGDIYVTDDAGRVPIRVSEDISSKSSFGQTRLFTPLRDTRGAVELRYSANIVPALSPRKRGPSYDLRGTDGAFSGANVSFLILPTDGSATYRTSVRWNMGHMPAGSIAASTLGAGDVTTLASGDTLMMTFIIAGKIGAYSAGDDRAPFWAYWMGKPDFDVRQTMQWTAKSYDALRAFFDPSASKPYYLIVRPQPNARDGGAATDNGFMLEYGTIEPTEAARRFMFTHEMVHNFVGTLEGQPGAVSWYGEGLAEFYKVRVPLRAGLTNVNDYATEIATMTHAYYSNPRNTLPNADIPAEYWNDGNVEGLAYNRGFMYFADLDRKIRLASHGKRSLDNLVLSMLLSRRSHGPYDEAEWRKLLFAELGQRGIDDFNRMLMGAIIVPTADTFGSCLERKMRTINQPWLGFTASSFDEPPYRVVRVFPATAAEHAGLRQGDTVVSLEGEKPSNLHSSSGFILDPFVTLLVKRDDKTFSIRISTKGPKVTEYYWVKKNGSDNHTCSL